MSQSVVVYQPCYYPKLHYFARIDDADVFVVFDDVEFSRRSRQHRCEIDFGSKRWLTIPVKHDRDGTLIKDARIDNSARWHTEHVETLVHKYGSDARRFEPYYDAVADEDDPLLVDVTVPTLQELLDAFDVDVELYRSSRMNATHPGDATTYLADIVEEVDGDEYICGRRAYENYLAETEFERRDIDVRIQDWEPTWKDGNVCALDLLFGAEEPATYIE
jgi:hypothetical protein